MNNLNVAPLSLKILASLKPILEEPGYCDEEREA